MNRFVGAAALGALLFTQGAGAADAQDQPPASETTPAPTYLFTQTAEDAVLEEGSLTMSGIGAMTLYFADAPGRQVGFLPHQRFVDYWHSEGSGFVDNPPNAALVVHNAMDAPTPIVELSDVAFEDGKLVYQAKLLEGDAARISGPASIVIDRGSGHPLFQDYPDGGDAMPPCNPHQGFFNDFFLCLK
ncbi:MAG: hypothetical protein RIC87_19480 [Kiloniellales bacterium]